MAASYPTSAKSFSTRNTGDTIQAAHVNELQDEVAAIETQLLTTGSYTPTWGNTGTANTLGNGTITGAYVQTGKVVHFTVTLTWGSTTSAGSGSQTVSLPITGTGVIQGVVNYSDASLGANHTGQFITLSPTAVTLLTTGSPAGGVTATSPITWTTSDAVTVSGWYIAS
jgi:hypothetical protein